MAFGAHISCADNNHLVSDEPGTNRTPGISDRGVVSYPLKTSVASKHHITPAIRYTLGRGNTNGHVYAILRTGKSPTHSIAQSCRVSRSHAAT